MEYGLYVVTEDRGPGRGHIDIARAAIAGGAAVIQYRDKNNSTRRQFEIAKEIGSLTRESGRLLIINDRPDIAIAANADGVHLGQDDLSPEDARRLLPLGMIIGVSATNFNEAQVAVADGADYIGVGPIFPTPSKADAAPPIGIEELARICASLDVPVVAIGGITVDNINQTLAAGADGIAVISAVTAAADMVAAAADMARAVVKGKENAYLN